MKNIKLKNILANEEEMHAKKVLGNDAKRGYVPQLGRFAWYTMDWCFRKFYIGQTLDDEPVVVTYYMDGDKVLDIN